MGHIANLMEELPEHLQGTEKEKCTDLAAKLGGKVIGANMHSALITLYTLLAKGAKQFVFDLHSVIKISEILYSDEVKETQSKFFHYTTMHGSIWSYANSSFLTSTSFQGKSCDGTSMHALTSHAPQQ